jgi:hypothetical protein
VSVLLFLNELSCASIESRPSVDRAMVQLVELLRTVRRWRGDIALVSQVPLGTVELAKGYSMQQWISAEAANRDRWRIIRAIQNRAPCSSVIPEGLSRDVEYQHDGRRADGLGAAHLLNGLAISLCLSSVWGRSWIPLLRSILVEGDDSGDPAIKEERVDVRHAATLDHAADHRIWVQEAGRDSLASGASIWASRGSFFPHLTFLPRVEEDLRDLRQDWVQSVVEVLLKLEQAVAEWKPSEVASPNWRTKITGDSETRKGLCEFLDTDGVIHIFELHARFTPGPGRLHFRLVPDDGTARIAYIGRKRGI